MPLAYLATPYQKFHSGRQGAFLEACKLASRLLSGGVQVFSPIAHGHPIATFGENCSMTEADWLDYDELLMAHCDCLIVAMLPGWEESAGIRHEIRFFENANKPIFEVNVETLTMTKREPQKLRAV
jgi:hypothetical protein